MSPPRGVGATSVAAAGLLLLATSLLVVLLALLVVPLRLALVLRGDTRLGFAGRIRLSAAGLRLVDRELRPRSPSGGGTGTAADATADAEPSSGSAHRQRGDAPARGDGRPAARFTRQAWRDRLRSRVVRLDVLLRLLRRRAVRVERPRGFIEYALADPAETGMVFGAVCAVASLADPDGDVAIAPLWGCEDFVAIDLTLEARIRLARVLAVVVPAALRAPGGDARGRQAEEARRDAA